MLDLATVTRAEFEACLNDEFRLCEAGQEYPLKLVEIRALGASYPGAKREPFALMFQGVPQLRAPQRIYRLTHPRLGEMDIFLVPTAPDAAGSYFEANFN